MEYSYPIDPSWSREELLTVISLLNAVEKAYEGGVASTVVADVYRRYKDMHFSISDEKELDQTFKQASGYSLHAVLTACKRGDPFIVLKVGQDD